MFSDNCLKYFRWLSFLQSSNFYNVHFSINFRKTSKLIIFDGWLHIKDETYGLWNYRLAISDILNYYILLANLAFLDKDWKRLNDWKNNLLIKLQYFACVVCVVSFYYLFNDKIQ